MHSVSRISPNGERPRIGAGSDTPLHALDDGGEALGRSRLASQTPRRATKKKASRKKSGRRRRQPASSGADFSDPVLAHIRSNPGSHAEEIAAELGADKEDVKRALQGLKAAGAVKAKGKARGTNYTAGATRKASKKKASRKKKGARRKRTVRKTSAGASA